MDTWTAPDLDPDDAVVRADLLPLLAQCGDDVPFLRSLHAEYSALIERAGTAAWAAHRARTDAEHEPERDVDAVEHDDLDALRTAYAHAVVRDDRAAIAATARRIVALHIAGVHR